MKILLLLLTCLVATIAPAQSVVVLTEKPLPIFLSIDTVVDNWNLSSPHFHNLTAREQAVFYWTNYARRNPKRFWDSVMVPILETHPQLNGGYASSLQSDLYKARSLPLLSLSDTLVRTARLHAADMARPHIQISHTSADGTSFAQRLQASGIRNCGSENMSLGSGDVLLSLALLYLDYNLPSLGHRKTLLDPSYVSVGIGGLPYGKDQYFFVQDFSCEQ